MNAAELAELFRESQRSEDRKDAAWAIYVLAMEADCLTEYLAAILGYTREERAVPVPRKLFPSD